MINVPETSVRRTDRKHCGRCGTSAATCRSMSWLRSELCCQLCSGDHDQPITTTKEN